MPYPPGNTVTVRDGGLGLSSSGDSPPLAIGVSNAGVANTLYRFTDPQILKTTLGKGPVVETALAMLLQAGVVAVLKTAATTAGSAGAVTKTAVGTSTGTVTVAGTPPLPFIPIILITKTGALGVARFMYSLDNGYTYSPELLVPSGGTYVVPNTGLTLTFVAGAGPIIFELGDSHTFVCQAPHYTTSDLSTAIAALWAQLGTLDIRKVVFTGRNATGSAGATMMAALDTHMTAFLSRRHFARALFDAGDDTAANAITAYAALSSDRLGKVFGKVEVALLDSFTGWGIGRLPLVHSAGERYAQCELSENMGRLLSGRLRGVRAIRGTTTSWGYDERIDGSFAESDKFITATTQAGRAGVWMTNGFLSSVLGSDFKYLEWGNVVDQACKTGDLGLLNWLNRNLRVLTDGTGYLDPREAERIDKDIQGQLQADLMDPTNIEGYLGHCSGVGFGVRRDTNFLSTQRLAANLNVVPLVPNQGVDISVGLARSVEG
jgi:hypothetical protein